MSEARLIDLRFRGGRLHDYKVPVAGCKGRTDCGGMSMLRSIVGFALPSQLANYVQQAFINPQKRK